MMGAMRLALVALLLMVSGCMFMGAKTPYAPPPPPVKADAPLWMVPEMLGTPLDVHFQPIQGGGTTVFPTAPKMWLPYDDFQHELVQVLDTTSFDANISAWGAAFGVRAGFSSSTENRFASYRAYDIHGISALDDRYPAAAPPPGAVWYPARIYWGHSYEVICSGDKNATTAKLTVKMKIVSGGAGVSDGQDNIQCKVMGRGLIPKRPGAIFADNDQAAREAYDECGATPTPGCLDNRLSPVAVEYRLIPGAALPPPGAIDWQSQLHVEVNYSTIHINHQSNWFDVSYQAQGFCNLDGTRLASATGIALRGDNGSDGTSLSTGWNAALLASPGQRLSCGLQGAFNGTWHSGPMPTASMPEFVIGVPGTFPGQFSGANGDTSYVVNYTVSVRAQ